MHQSRLCALLIDCRTPDIDEAASFWAGALGRALDPGHPGTRGNYRMLETPPDEPIVQIQRVEHESRVHIDIETDDIPAEVARLEALGAQVVDRLERWVVMQAPTGQRFCVVRVQRPGFPKNATRWGAQESAADDEALLIGLETSLWREASRFDAAHLERTLASDFAEIGASGRQYDRVEIMAVERQAIRAELGNMSVSFLAPGLAQLRYDSCVTRDGVAARARRSSIWSLSEGRWMLRFHQGTPVTEAT